MKFYEAIKEFSGWKSFSTKADTIHGYQYDLRAFCLYLRNPELETVGWKDMQDYMNMMIELGWDKNTFVRKFIAFRKFFQYWHKKDSKYLDPEWIPVMHAEMKQPRVIDEENYHKLISTFPKEPVDPRHIRNLAIFNLFWDTGARNNEILSLNIDDVDLDNKKAIIRTEKARIRRVFREIFWTDETNENLRAWLVKRTFLQVDGMIDKDSKALFVSINGTKSGQRLMKNGLAELFRHACDRAKIKHFNPHSFRHHMGHDIIEKGGSNSDVSNILGHSKIESSFIYTMMTNKELERRYRQFKGQ
jgi:integrase/recombinase XerC